MSTTFETVSLDEIILDPIFQPRVETKDVESLAEDIRVNGLLNPLTVWKRGKDLVLLAGHRRYLALKSLKAKMVAVNVKEDLDPVSALTIVVSENAEREDLNPVEEARLVTVAQVNGMKLPAIAKAFRKAPAWVHDRLRLYLLPDTIKEHLVSGKWDVGAALEFARQDGRMKGRMLEVIIGTWDKDRDQRGNVCVGDVQRLIRSVREDVKEEDRLLARAKGAKVSACPKCGAPPYEERGWPEDAVGCAEGHTWRLSGKAEKEVEPQTQFGGERRDPSYQPVDLVVPLDMPKVGLALVRLAESHYASLVGVRVGGGEGSWDVTFSFRRGRPEFAKGTEVVFKTEGKTLVFHPFTDGDDKQRVSRRKALQEFLHLKEGLVGTALARVKCPKCHKTLRGPKLGTVRHPCAATGTEQVLQVGTGKPGGD